MNRNQKIVSMLFLVFILSSCGLFKKKNKCVSCPTWDNVEIGAELEPDCQDD